MTVLLDFSLAKGDYYMFFDKTGTMPILQSFITAGDSVILKSLDNKTTAFKTMRYKYEFDPALSPMATGQRVPQKACTPTRFTPFSQIKLSDLI
jgi:hypothetical protein